LRRSKATLQAGMPPLSLDIAMTKSAAQVTPAKPALEGALPEATSAGAPASSVSSAPPKAPEEPGAAPRPREIGGPKGPEPTRYGDWEVGGRCSDF
jgi:hypothetical protein